MTFHARSALALLISISAFAQTARAECSTDLIKPFLGAWEGTAVLATSSGAVLTSGTRDVFSLRGCDSFDVDVSYLDAAGKVARGLHLTATSVEPEKPELFVVAGAISEGPNVSPMTGTFQVSPEGHLLGHFSGAIGGQSAYLSEAMNLNGETQLVRTVQMSAIRMGGNDIGTRVVHDRKVQ